MASRIELHNKLVELFGSRNVYYQPPENLKMKYPAIRYSKQRLQGINADDTKYIKNTQYELTVIDEDPDNKVIDKLLEIPYTTLDSSYVVDNLHHDVLSIFW